jgi:hypothetical protein
LPAGPSMPREIASPTAGNGHGSAPTLGLDRGVQAVDEAGI